TRLLVEAQGGRVGAHSEPGKGSCFYAVLPCGRRTVQASEQTMAAMVVPPDGPRALVLEDDGRDQRSIAKALREAGYWVEIAPNGARAIELARRRSYDEMALDIILPDMSGLDVLRVLRQEGKIAALPVVVINVVGENAAAGFTVSGVLVKPVDGSVVVES